MDTIVNVKYAMAGTVIYPPGGEFGPRVQLDLQLVLLHTGAMTVWVDDCVHVVPPGHLILLDPEHRERFQFATDEETWHRWIAIRVHPLPNDVRSQLHTQNRILPISDELNQLTDLMLRIQANEHPANNATLRVLGLAALQLYVRDAQLQNINERTHPSVLLTKSVIRERFSEDVKLADLADAANVNKDYLIRLFKKHEQMTPIQYLWHYRNQQSAHLLRNTGLSIQEIADQNGYKSSYHFSRKMKQHYGKTPTEIRQENWNL